MIRLLMLALLAFAAAPGQARAAASAPIVSTRMTARLITDADSARPGQHLRVGLQLSPAPGWHTYWHDPGDAGAAPTFDLTAPGAAIGGLSWPLPQRINEASIATIGYEAQLVLIRAVTVQQASSTGLTLAASATWLVCRNVCVPEQGSFTLALPAGDGAPSPERALFDAQAIPAPAAFSAHLAPDGTLWFTGAPAAAALDFLPDDPDSIVQSAPQHMQRQDNLLTLALKPGTGFQPNAPMTGVLVLAQGGNRVGYRIAATPAALPQVSTRSSSASLPLTILFAIAGGLILNLMPCVFPVLAMKAVGFARLGGAGRGQIRAEALAYTAGVMLSILTIGALLLTLRAAGAAAGWGFQFQWPGFVAAMAWLFFAVGLNLSGVFDIGGSWMGAGQSLASRGGLAGSFATGLLAVLVATPCTAPFMGVAIAAALAAPPIQALSVFAALGLGFALPWLALASYPRAAAIMPAPGAWMEHLRQFLAFPMYAASVWLMWVLSQQAGSGAVLAVGAGGVLIALGAWLARVSGRSVLALVCVAAALALLPGIGKPPSRAISSESFGADRLANLRASNQPVFVNMTAAWCVTCLVNERVALEPALPRLKQAGVAYLVGDWTRRDPSITAFLRRYGRDGVPLYVYFPPGKDGRVLPQILTPGLVAGLAKG